MFPLIFGSLYAAYRYQSFRWTSFFTMLFSLFVFDMTTTAINNYMDYKKSNDDEYRRNFNIIGQDELKISQVKATIFLMLMLAIISGIYLVILTGPIVLILGILSFIVGIFYTFGPIPISRMPLGEILSGFFMGFIIIYLAVYIHNPELAVINYSMGRILTDFSLYDTLALFLVALPFTLGISNLMLANNICDLEQDVRNDRYLLPYYLGRKISLIIFRWSYYVALLAPIISVILKFQPIISLLSLIVLIPVNKNIGIFAKKQIKGETFVLSVKNLILLSIANILPLAGYLLIQAIGIFGN